VRINQRLFVFLILALCLLAIPVGLLSTHFVSQIKADSDDDGMVLPFQDHIEVVRISGLIAEPEERSFLFSSDDSASSALKQMRKAVKNEHVKGILLRINSPGGTVPTSQELTDEVNALKKANKPVVVSMGDLAASGGYYVASASDRIIAQPGTLTGSIGVIMNTVNVQELLKKIGVAPEAIKTGPFKDLASPTRPMTPEDRAIIQAIIADSYDQFVTAVAKGRKMKVETVKQIGDGRVYSGRQALKLGLVDELGGYDQALDALQKICMKKFGLTEKLPVDEHAGEGFLSMLFEASTQVSPLRGSMDSVFGIDKLLPKSMSARFYKQPLWVMQ